MTLVDSPRQTAGPPENDAVRGGASFWGAAALGALSTAVAGTLWLHVELATRVDPVSQVISDYALSGGAGWFAGSAAALAGAMVLLTIGLLRAGIPLSTGFFVPASGWCLGLTVCMFVPTDPTGGSRTVGGAVHLVAGAVLFVCLPSALRALTVHCGPRHADLAARLRRWTRWCWGTLAVFAATQVCVVFSGPGAYFGLPVQGLCERLALATYIAAMSRPAIVLFRLERKPC
ncbi:DUF998 domain-containing protein [Amycolatopsis sp. GM8]|uniref:DUF998 domain-containing protein n=1 Tax=Amycolatopsis sp. GM8 TaxID=2896530 RepID=UPI001F2EF8FE|nr:DUF998 domain-containing protein [Amycolatopsis sp. GM8]